MQSRELKERDEARKRRSMERSTRQKDETYRIGVSAGSGRAKKRIAHLCCHHGIRTKITRGYILMNRSAEVSDTLAIRVQNEYLFFFGLVWIVATGA